MASTQNRRLWPILLIILAIVAAYAGITYNRLVKEDENVKLNWGNLQNTYQRRIDLVPNLASVVKASSEYEKQTLQELTEARRKGRTGHFERRLSQPGEL